MKVLCFQPHNDDCAIAIGGIMQKLLKHAGEVTYVYITNGRHGSDVVTPQELVEVRKAEARGERSLLGIHHYFELGVEDGSVGRLRGVRLESLKQQMASVLADNKADLIFVPTKSDMHPDHRATHDLVLEVVEDIKPASLVMKYFVWLFPDFYKKLPDVANRVLMVGIDHEMATKMAAIRVHQSQVTRGAFDSMVQMLNAYLAYAFRAPATIGSRYVEIVGLFGSSQYPRVTSELLKVLEPCADITNILHGRLSQGIRAQPQ